MKKFEDLDLNNVDWSKYNKQLSRIQKRLDGIRNNKDMMKRLNEYKLEEKKIRQVSWKEIVLWLLMLLALLKFEKEYAILIAILIVNENIGKG